MKGNCSGQGLAGKRYPMLPAWTGGGDGLSERDAHIPQVIDELRHQDILLSKVYAHGPSGVVVVDQEAIFTEPFSYKRYCQKQNEWMQRFAPVYRFVEGQADLQRFLRGGVSDSPADYSLTRTMDRESMLADPTPLEYRFEECFIDAFGEEAVKYLKREFSFVTDEGKTVYVDYALFRKDETWIAIEENGVTFHHPLQIGLKRYLKILQKQNAIVTSRGTVFRWDTESLVNRQRIVDELREFIGDLNDFAVQTSLTSSRGFVLHHHQTDHLVELDADRRAGKSAALVVLPTGTGKTLIALEDMKRLERDLGSLKGLILVPSLDLVQQWAQEIHRHGLTGIEVLTYSAVARRYFSEDPHTYDYIVVDEAHHAVAPVLKKAIQHYQPRFLLGLTATDRRLDERSLESVFGNYDQKLDLKQAIEVGLLSQIRAFRLESNLDLSQVRFNGRDYVAADLERRVRVTSRNELIANVLHKYFYSRLPGKSGLVFCVNIAHAKEMARLLRETGFTAESVDGSDPRRHYKVKAYMERRTRFLCTCSLLTEGWDAPHTSVIVMARPTMSRVLYTQQLGRGTRLAEGKEALYVIDVVDDYGSFGGVTNRPWSAHALLGIDAYTPFGDLLPRPGGSQDELIILGTTREQAIRLRPFELFTLQSAYEDHLSVESLARELFVSTGTVNSWINRHEITPDVEIPMGRSTIRLFHPDQVPKIRQAKDLKEHNEETIVRDFWDFIAEGDYSFSYKMFFILALLDRVDSTGDVDVDLLRQRYRDYYLERMDQSKVIDRPNCPYQDRDYLMDDKALTRSILSNPFEKFERKRFLYHARDLKKISIHHRIWDDLTRGGAMEKLRSKMKEDLAAYYEPLGGY